MNPSQPLSLNDFRIKITAHHHEFSEAELKVAECFEQIFHNLPYFGITDISRKSKTSKATVGRFLNKIGFLGFSRFKSSVSAALKDQKLPLPVEIISDTTTETDKNILKEQVNDVIKNLSDSYQQIEPQAFSDAVDLMSDLDRKIYVYCPTAANSVASHLVTMSSYIRNNVYQLEGNLCSFPHQLMDTKSGDVLFVTSFYRFTNVGVRVAKWFKAMGGKVILLTNSAINPYASFSDVELVVSSQGQSVFQNRSTAMVIAEALLFAMTTRLGEQERFQKMEELFDEFDPFQDW